jgi:hypothetical protein
MAGDWHGKRIADTFLGFLARDPKHANEQLQDYLEQQDDPRLAEIMARLDGVYHAYYGEA